MPSATGTATTIPVDQAADAQSLNARCAHCGSVCLPTRIHSDGSDFCCRGCLTVYEVLHENGLADFYRLADRPGSRASEGGHHDRYAVLDDPEVCARLLEFSSDQLARVSFYLPEIHCIACMWLLENLYKLNSGIGRSHVNFEAKRVTITFDPEQIRLRELADLLATVGYPPRLQLDSLDRAPGSSVAKALYLRLGVAGFAFGNIMLLSICQYAGMDRFSAPLFQPLFGWVSLVLAVPVLGYSASGYWRSAWVGLRQRSLTIDFPIAVGLAALFIQSLVEVMAGHGVGYLDSLTGLVFFLLVGRVFQDRVYRRLSFDRDYKSFFPLSVVRVEQGEERTVPLSALAVGDRLRVRHGEIVPADSRVVVGRAFMDYSFVTGESEPVACAEGDSVHAGGQQMGGAVEVEIIKPVSQSYLTSLWSHEAFQKQGTQRLDNLLNRFSRGFTFSVIGIALAAGAWWWSEDMGRAVRAFTSVLIVACPCALALSAPFALGTAQRLLARIQVFTRNSQVIETLGRVRSIVFDKTGTLTERAAASVRFEGDALSDEEAEWVVAATSNSTHPQATRIGRFLGRPCTVDLDSYHEESGKGIRARVRGREIHLGSAEWIREAGIDWSENGDRDAGAVHLAIESRYRGRFQVTGSLRANIPEMVSSLSHSHGLVLLSGDSECERSTFEVLLGKDSRVRFRQGPEDKLNAIAELQATCGPVMMVGDGLNDAGALRQSDVGVAVVEEVGAFSPASDVILEATRVPALHNVLEFARRSVAVVWGCIAISLLYNLVGIAFAASGRLSPVVCAILMPLSSITVVAFACFAVQLAARRVGLASGRSGEGAP